MATPVPDSQHKQTNKRIALWATLLLRENEQIGTDAGGIGNGTDGRCHLCNPSGRSANDKCVKHHMLFCNKYLEGVSGKPLYEKSSGY